MRSEKEYKEAAKASKSLSDMCRFLGILPRGANFDTLKHAIARYKISTEHFDSPVVLQDSHGKFFNRNSKMRKLLIEKYGYKCSNPKCQIAEWNKKEITLQVDHIDGNNTNDSTDNVRLLCPNCHYETDTYCINSNKNIELSSICQCGNKKKRESRICGNCVKKQNINNTTHLTREPKKYSKEFLEPIIASSTSYRQVLQKLNLKDGSSQTTIKNAVYHYNINISHFTGQSWNKGLSISENPKNKSSWKNKLILERGHKCERCKRTKWVSGNAIPLELEHVDGNNKNNVRANLKLLCPNCHSQTKTWKRRKSSSNKMPAKCVDCDKVISDKATRCVDHYRIFMASEASPLVIRNRAKRGTSTLKPINDICLCGATKLTKSKQCEACFKKSLERIVWPSHDALEAMVAKSSYLAVGRLLGVSDNAVRKRLKNH